MKKTYQEWKIDLLFLTKQDVLTFSFEEDAKNDIFGQGDEDGIKW